MKKRYLHFMLTLLSLVSISLAFLFSIKSNDLNLDALYNPVWGIGQLLRNLSLKGDFQNIVAVILFVLLGLSPVAIILHFSIRRRKFAGEDILAFPISILVYFLLYFSVNPTLLPESLRIMNNPWFSIFVMSGILFSLVLGLMFIKLLKYLNSSSTHLTKILKYAFFMLACFLVVIVFFAGAYQLLSDLNFRDSGQNLISQIISTKSLILFFKYFVESAPLVIGVIISILAINLIDEIEINKFSRKVSKITTKIIAFSKVAIFTIIFGNILTNILQIIFRDMFSDLRIVSRIPFVFILVMLVMILFGKYLSESSDMKEDLDGFV